MPPNQVATRHRGRVASASRTRRVLGEIGNVAGRVIPGFAQNVLRHGMRAWKMRKQNKVPPKTKKSIDHVEKVSLAAVNPTDLQFRHITVPCAKMKHKNAIKGLWTYQQEHDGVIATGAGLQQTATLFMVNTVSQLATSTGAGYTSLQNFTALQQLNPYLTNTGSALWGSRVTPATDKFIIKSIEIDLDLTSPF